mgnify:CR=1 FL=1
MDQNLAYMYKMVQEAEGKLIFRRETLETYGAKVNLFPGVRDWFTRICDYGAAHDVIVEHYKMHRKIAGVLLQYTLP